MTEPIPAWQTAFYDWVSEQSVAVQGSGLIAQLEEYLRLFPERRRPKKPLAGNFTCSQCNKLVAGTEVWWIGSSPYHRDCVS